MNISQKFLRSIIVVIYLITFLIIKVHTSHALYENYVNNIQPNAQITSETQPIQQELEKKVLEVVSGGHWAPTIYWNGLAANSNFGQIFYATPLDVLYSLSYAYPYLSPSLQSSVKTYLQSEISSYPPHSTAYFIPFSGTLGQWTGSRHEYFSINPGQPYNIWPPPVVNISILYPIWLYSYNTNNWTYSTTNYSSIKSIYTSFKSNSNGVITSYPQLAGVIGFARIAKQLNNSQSNDKLADYNDAKSFAEQGFTAGVNFDQFLTSAKTNFPNGDQRYSTPIFITHRSAQTTINPISLHINKDVGKFIFDNSTTKSQALTYANQIAKDIPLPYLTGVGITWGENLYATPEISWTYFMLKAYTQKDSVANLKKILDLPDRKADYFYIQKLVATIEAPSSNVTLTPTSQPTSTPTPKPGDCEPDNGDSDVDIFDYNRVVSNFNSTTNLQCDFVSPGTIDIFDYNTVVSNFGL